MTSGNGPITLSREQLYQRVWETPMRHLAKEYGLSDVGLAKVCKKHKIPRPGVGYWAKVEHGKSVKKPRLPKVSEARLETIELYAGQVISDDEPADYDEPDEIAAERLPENQITVPGTLQDPHPLIVRTEKTLRVSRQNDSDIVHPRAKRAMNVFIGLSSIDRAMRILDSLVKALERRSHSVSVEFEEERRSTIVDIHGEPIEFELTEIVAREEREPTAYEARQKEKYSWADQGPFYRYFPSGRLCLQIITNRAYGLQRRWADGKRRRIETCLNPFIRSLLWLSLEVKEQRRKREEERRRREEWERKRSEKLELIRNEEERLKQLNDEVDLWHRSQIIRAYIENARERAIAAYGEIDEDSKLDRWLSWATQQADRVDPLVESPSSILDEKRKWEYGWYR